MFYLNYYKKKFKILNKTLYRLSKRSYKLKLLHKKIKLNFRNHSSMKFRKIFNY